MLLLDVGAVLAIFAGSVLGARRGLWKFVAGGAAVSLGAAAGLRLCGVLASALRDWGVGSPGDTVLGFFIPFALVSVYARFIIGLWLSRRLEARPGSNRLLGAAGGALWTACAVGFAARVAGVAAPVAPGPRRTRPVAAPVAPGPRRARPVAAPVAPGPRRTRPVAAPVTPGLRRARPVAAPVTPGPDSQAPKDHESVRHEVATPGRATGSGTGPSTQAPSAGAFRARGAGTAEAPFTTWLARYPGRLGAYVYLRAFERTEAGAPAARGDPADGRERGRAARVFREALDGARAQRRASQGDAEAASSLRKSGVVPLRLEAGH